MIILRRSLYLLRINSVNTLIDQVLIDIIRKEPIFTLIIFLAFIDWLQAVGGEGLGRGPNVLIFAVEDVVVHRMRLLFVRVRFNDLINHLLLFLLVPQ